MSTLHELRFALSQATPGEWDACRHATPEYHPQFGVFVHEEPNDFAIIKGEGNTEFIVLAHNMMPTLLEAVDALKDCHARLELLTESGRSKMLDACAKHKAALVLEKLK